MIVGIGDIPTVNYCKKGIKIKESHKGLFTDYCGGKVTDECILKAKNSKNPTLRKRATFALNARGWSKKHQLGGIVEAGSSFIPIVGTYQSYKDWEKDPSVSNALWTVASGVGDVLLLTGLGYGLGSAIKGLRAANAARKAAKTTLAARQAVRQANQAKMLEYGDVGRQGYQGWIASGKNVKNSQRKVDAAALALKDEAMHQGKNTAKGFALTFTDPVDWAETVYNNNN